MNRTESTRSKSWFFHRSRIHAQRAWLSKLGRGKKRRSPARTMLMEALEPRVLFSAAPVDAPPAMVENDSATTADAQVSIDMTQPQTDPSGITAGPGVEEEMIGETFNFTVGFENSGAATGYGPYVDIVTPGGVELTNDPTTGQMASMSGIDISTLVQPVGHVVEFNATSMGDYQDAVVANGGPLGNDWDEIAAYFSANGAMNIWVAEGTDMTSSTFDFTNAPPLSSHAVPSALPGANYPGEVVVHPMLDHFAGPPQPTVDANNFSDGDSFYTVELPYGSYVPGISPKEITFAATLNSGTGNQDTDSDHFVSVGDTVGRDTVEVAASGGFRYGATPGGTDDAALVDGVGECVKGEITATVIELKKDVEGDDHERVSGPTNPFTYSLDLDIAKDVTLTDLTITDVIPDNMIYVPNSVTITFPNGATVQAPVHVTQPHDTVDNYYAGNSFVANEDPNLPGGTL
ncbi:MAG: LEPR-XLL domain-containing protein, partial [Verrucomicrobiota bacterium]